jgi:hypothetical protein
MPSAEQSLFCLTSDYKKFILNLSKHILTDPEEEVLVKSLSLFYITTWTMACAVESVVSKLPDSGH